MLECLHPDCSREFDSKKGRNSHFTHHEDYKSISLEILSREEKEITFDKCSDLTGLSGKFYENNFGSWNNALKEAGVEVNSEKNISEKKLLDELRKMSEDGTVRYNEMRDSGKYSPRVYVTRFGSWKGGHKSYRGESWSSSRKQTRSRANGICEHPNCDKDKNDIGRNLDVHHIISFRYFDSHKEANKLDNLILLCPKHHNKEEARIWRIESIQNS